MTSGRLEAFSDGLIAVIITIMVLELHVPHDDGWAGLWSVAPRLAVYFLNFFTVGIYWIPAIQFRSAAWEERVPTQRLRGVVWGTSCGKAREPANLPASLA